MLYTIELAIKNNTSMKNTINEITNAAVDLSCYDYSTTHEYEKYKKAGKHKIIYLITVKFAEDNIQHCLQFIQIARRNKNIYIESIYSTKLLYASSYYKRIHDTRIPKKINYTESEQLILQIIS